MRSLSTPCERPVSTAVPPARAGVRCALRSSFLPPVNSPAPPAIAPANDASPAKSIRSRNCSSAPATTSTCNLDTTILWRTGQVLGLSPFHAQRLFRRALGVTPRQYQQSLRMERFRSELEHQPSVTDAIYQSGFSSGSRLYENARGDRHDPHRISQKRKGADNPLRHRRVAAGQDACGRDRNRSLRNRLWQPRKRAGRRSPRPLCAGRIIRDDDGLGEILQQVLARLSEHPLAADLPLDVRATAFQRRVWTALQEIPRGETRSYAQIAAEIGHPRAVRAVAHACAANPVAVVIPCHRVIGSNGKLTGYRWGVERKKDLLEMERRSPSASV